MGGHLELPTTGNTMITTSNVLTLVTIIDVNVSISVRIVAVSGFKLMRILDCSSFSLVDKRAVPALAYNDHGNPTK